MRSRLLATVGLALGLGLPFGCAKAPAPPSLAPAVSDTIDDQGATFGVDVGWRSVSAEEVEVEVRMAAQGIEQTDKLVVDVATHGFVISEGTPQWSGFVLPRERYRHQVIYKMLDDENSGRATITIRRSMDGTLLWDTELLFTREGGSVRLAE